MSEPKLVDVEGLRYLMTDAVTVPVGAESYWRRVNAWHDAIRASAPALLDELTRLREQERVGVV